SHLAGPREERDDFSSSGRVLRPVPGLLDLTTCSTRLTPWAIIFRPAGLSPAWAGGSACPTTASAGFVLVVQAAPPALLDDAPRSVYGGAVGAGEPHDDLGERVANGRGAAWLDGSGGDQRFAGRAGRNARLAGRRFFGRRADPGGRRSRGHYGDRRWRRAVCAAGGRGRELSRDGSRGG